MSRTYALDCVVLADVVLQLFAIKRETSFGLIQKPSPGGDPDVVFVMGFDVAPGPVSLFELAVDLGMAGRTY